MSYGFVGTGKGVWSVGPVVTRTFLRGARTRILLDDASNNGSKVLTGVYMYNFVNARGSERAEDKSKESATTALS